MSGRAPLAILLVAATAATTLRAQQSALDSVAARCTGQDTATAWRRVLSAWRVDSTRKGTDDSLRRRLLALARADQSVRAFPDLADSMRDSTFVRRMMVRDSTDSATLRAIIDHYGWPGRSLVGADGASAAWQVVQHILGMQPEVLRRMQALPPGEVSPTDLAMLADRVAVLHGKAQRYGTQLDTQNRFYPIADLPHLDERRAAVGLPPLSVYLCLMRAFTGLAVRDPRPLISAETPPAIHRPR